MTSTKRVQKWRKADPERYRRTTTERRRELRRQVLDHYGSVCACCGEHRFEFLAIDHVNGGGNKHRKETGAGKEFVAWLIRNNYPTGYQVLCHSCNLARGFYGTCPHETERIQQRDAFVAALGVA